MAILSKSLSAHNHQNHFDTSFENFQELRPQRVDKQAGTTQIYV